jgi:hypothetical protein
MMSWKELIAKVNQSADYEAVWNDRRLRRKSDKDGKPITAPRLVIRSRKQPSKRICYKLNVKTSRAKFGERPVKPSVLDQLRRFQLPV